MPAHSAYTLATLLVPPVCLLIALVALALFWRRLRHSLRQLVREPASLELYTQEGALPLRPRSRVGGDEEEDEEGGGSGGQASHPSRGRRTRRSSTLSICTTLAVDGTRVLTRRERVLSAEVTTSEGGEGRRSSFFLTSSMGSSRREGRQATLRARAADEGREEEATEELAAAADDGSASDSLQDEPPSAEWIRRSFPSPRSLPSREAAQGDEEAGLGRPTSSSSLFFVDPEAEDALSDFIRLLEPVAPPTAYRLSGRGAGMEEDEGTELGRLTSGTREGRERTRLPLSSPATSPPHSPPPLPYPPPPPSTHHPFYPFATSPPSHPHFHPRPPTRSAPTPLPSDSTLLRSTSSPELRPYRHTRRTTDPLATWSVFSAPETTFSPLYHHSYPYPSSSADLYPLSMSRPGWRGSESTLFNPSPPSPPPPLPAWPPSPPRTPRSPSSPSYSPPPSVPPSQIATNAPLTDFPLPTLPRRPPRASRPAHLSSYTLPSSSFGAPSSPTAAPAATSMSGSRWSFRRPSTTASLRWRGSWGKKSRASAAEAARERERTVSKELLAPLSASIKPVASEVPPTPPLPALETQEEEDEEVVKEKLEEENEKGHARKSSVGTLESWVARGMGKVGGGDGGELTLTNPDPSLPSSSFPSSRRPSVDLSLHTSVRVSILESVR